MMNSFLPFGKRKLGLSAEAIKVIARELPKQGLLSAIMAGLRTERDNTPFTVFEKPLRDITIIGSAGSGFREASHSYMHSASRSGFRIIAFHSAHNLLYQGYKGNEAVLWEQDPHDEQKTFIRRGGYSKSQAINLIKPELTNPFVRQGISDFLLKNLNDSSVRQLLVKLPFRIKSAYEDYDKLLSHCLGSLFDVGDSLSDCVVFLEEADVPDMEGNFLRERAGGVLRILTPRTAKKHSRPTDDCLFMKSPVYTEDLGIMEARFGKFRDFDNVHAMPKFIPPYPSDSMYEISPAVNIMIKRIDPGTDFDSLSYMRRLNLVAKAAGYKNWDSLQGAPSTK